jgi:hypothetical protein
MSPADIAALGGELAKRLVELSLLTYLDWYWPRTSAMLRVLGLTEYTTDPGTPGDPTKPPFTVRALKIDRLPKLLGHPVDHFAFAVVRRKLLLEVLTRSELRVLDAARRGRLEPRDAHIPAGALVADSSV